MSLRKLKFSPGIYAEKTFKPEPARGGNFPQKDISNLLDHLTEEATMGRCRQDHTLITVICTTKTFCLSLHLTSGPRIWLWWRDRVPRISVSLFPVHSCEINLLLFFYF